MKFELKNSNFLYAGSPVCHDYGYKHFYYVSCVMNCPFDCAYCFLKGKYNNREIVVYKNLSEYFDAVDVLLDRIPACDKLYLCVSFDTDLFALENKIHYVEQWAKFAATRNRLRCEIRTKAQVDLNLWPKIINDNMIYAFSISPEQIIDEFEKGTANLDTRIKNVNDAVAAGANIRLCLDPIVYRKGWKEHYKSLAHTISEKIVLEKIQDVSIGTFRIPADYLKIMRENYPGNPLAQFPYALEDGFYQYPEYLRQEVEGYAYDLLRQVIPQEKIFMWK